jgi:molybdate transport system substrate-binding protein
MVKGLLFFFCCSLFFATSQAATLKVAVAANFKPLLKQLKPQFEQQHSIKLSLSSASTGVLYAQITHGAPFDVLLAADEKRPRLLEQNNLIVKDSRKTYAIGQLVLWHNDKNGGKPNKVLLAQWPDKIAVANAKTAPYGLAAQSVMKHLGLFDSKRSQFVTGSNIAQTNQFVASGNVNLGFVALAQVKGMSNYWLLPSEWYLPIKQQSVILKRSKLPDESKAFLSWLLSAKIQQQIASAGYALSDATLQKSVN